MRSEKFLIASVLAIGIATTTVAKAETIFSCTTDAGFVVKLVYTGPSVQFSYQSTSANKPALLFDVAEKRVNAGYRRIQGDIFGYYLSFNADGLAYELDNDNNASLIISKEKAAVPFVVDECKTITVDHVPAHYHWSKHEWPSP